MSRKCGNCDFFRPETSTCGKPTRCGATICTKKYFPVCRDYKPKEEAK